MALWGNFGKIDPRIHFDVFQITLFRAILKNVKIDLGLLFPNCPQSHAITSTNHTIYMAKSIKEGVQSSYVLVPYTENFALQRIVFCERYLIMVLFTEKAHEYLT